MIDPPAFPLPDPALLRGMIERGPPVAAAGVLLPGARVTGLTVERVHFPAARPVQLQVTVRCSDAADRVLIGEWVGPGAAETARLETARLAKPRRGQGPAAGELALAGDPDSGLVLRRPGHDVRLPGLRLLHDADWARDRLAALGCPPDARVSLVAHRLGKRAVLRIEGRDGTRYARLRPVTSGAGRLAHDRHQALWRALAGAQGLTIPRPLAFDDAIGLALYDALPGAPPDFRGLDGFRATRAAMRALAALQDLTIDAPPHRPEDELAILAAWAARTDQVFPELGSLLRPGLGRVTEAMAALRPLPGVPCHRDLHERQILLHDGRAGLLDFDTLRLGDPALDAGNLQAHLVLAALRDGRPRGAFVTAMDNALPRLPLARIALWRRAALLRLAMIYAFSAEPRAVVLGLIREAG